MRACEVSIKIEIFLVSFAILWRIYVDKQDDGSIAITQNVILINNKRNILNYSKSIPDSK
jgi:hypothetical protein